MLRSMLHSCGIITGQPQKQGKPFVTDDEELDRMMGTTEPLRLQKRPVAFRVKDYADGWIIFQDEQQANDYADKTGALIQGLYVRDGT